jgi:putative transposase
MVSPARRRDAVRYLVRRFPVSERRACRLLGQHRSTQRYRPLHPEYELRLVKRMNELAARHPRYGYRRVWALLRTEAPASSPPYTSEREQDQAAQRPSVGDWAVA